jgi:hypothetical protein
LRRDLQGRFDFGEQAVFFGVDALLLFVVVEHQAVALLFELLECAFGVELFLKGWELPGGLAGFLDFLVELLDADVEGDAAVFGPAFELFGFFAEVAFVQSQRGFEFLAFLLRQLPAEFGVFRQRGCFIEDASGQG